MYFANLDIMVFEEKDNMMILRVRLMPNSSCCCVGGIFTSSENIQYLKINVVSVPEKGKANKELIAFLAKMLKIAKSSFTIISGETDRYKKIMINGNTKEFIDKLMELLNKGDK